MLKTTIRTKFLIMLIFIMVFVSLTVTGCKKKDKDEGKNIGSDSSGGEGSDIYNGNYGAGYGLADPNAIYDAGQLIQLDGSETFMVSVEDGYPWMDSKEGLSDGEKYIAVPVEYTDYENGGKDIIAPEHVYLTEAKDENGNDLSLDGKLKPVTDMPESEIKSNADTYYNSVRPFKTDSGYEMELWALYKVPEDTKECVIEFFPDDDFSKPHAGGFRISIKENTTYGTMEDKSAVEIAEMLNTEEKPSLEEFAWYTGAIRAAEDYCHFNNRHADYTGDNYMGGWKAYLFLDPDNEEGKFEAHLANISIENFEPEDEYREGGFFDITLKWYMGFDADGNVTDESSKDDIVEKHATFTYNRMNNEEGEGYPDISFSIDFGGDTAYGTGVVELSKELQYRLVVVRPDGKVLNQYGADTEHMPGSKTVKLPADMKPTSKAEGGSKRKDADEDAAENKERPHEESDGFSNSGNNDEDDGEEHYGPAAAARQKKEGNPGGGTAGDSEMERDPDFDGTGSGGYGVPTSGDYRIGTYDGKGRGPASNQKNNSMQSTATDNYSDGGSSSSDSDGYIDWSGEYYAGPRAYVISGSDKEYLDKDSIKNMDDKVLRLAINEIYARHGRKFNDSELQSFFDGKDWYSPKYSPDEFDKKQNSILNDVEKKNLQVLSAERKRRG